MKAKPKPLTDRMRLILKALAKDPNGRFTPTEIAWHIGIKRGPHRAGNLWSGYQSPAQHVTFALTALRNRKLIGMTTRPDGLSGTAYFITDAGLKTLRALQAA